MRYQAERDLIANTVTRLHRWGMLDSTGGAVSCRAADGNILVTSSGTSFRSWEMTPSDVIALTPDGTVVDQTSRPAASGTQLHLAIYEHFPAAGGVVHAHAPQSLAFASLGLGLPAVTNQLDTLGEVPCLVVDDAAIKAGVRAGETEVDVPSGIVARPDVHAVTVALIPHLLTMLGHRAHEVARHGLGFLIYRHGAVTLARSLYEATENMARIESAARTARYQAQLRAGIGWQQHPSALRQPDLGGMIR